MKAFSHWLVRPLLYFSICCLGSVSVRADYIETKLQSFSPGADLIIASRSGGEIVTLSDSTTALPARSVPTYPSETKAPRSS